MKGMSAEEFERVQKAFWLHDLPKTCSQCGGESHGAVGPLLLPLYSSPNPEHPQGIVHQGAGAPVVGIVCDSCGHMILFAWSPLRELAEGSTPHKGGRGFLNRTTTKGESNG